MIVSESVIPISYAKAHTAEVVEGVVRDQRPVVVTRNGRASVVIQDIHSYELTQESLAMLKIVAMGQEDLRKGRHKPFRESFAEIREAVKQQDR